MSSLTISRIIESNVLPDGTLTSKTKKDAVPSTVEIPVFNEPEVPSAITNWLLDNTESDSHMRTVTLNTLKELRDHCFAIFEALDGEIIRVPKSELKAFKKWNNKLSAKNKHIQRVFLEAPIPREVDYNMEILSRLNNQLTGHHILSKRQWGCAEVGFREQEWWNGITLLWFFTIAVELDKFILEESTNKKPAWAKSIKYVFE